MRQGTGLRKATAGAVAVLMFSSACLVVSGLLKHVPFGQKDPPQMYMPPMPDQPDLTTLAPGAQEAILKALGQSGIQRISAIIRPSDPYNLLISGSHGASGSINGHPYGLAFDVTVPDPSRGQSDARKLRLQGIAAWYRGPGSLDGGGGPYPHIHCIWPGAPTNNPVNLEELSSFIHAYKDANDEDPIPAEWHDISIKPDEIARVNAVYNKVYPHRPLSEIVPRDSVLALGNHPG